MSRLEKIQRAWPIERLQALPGAQKIESEVIFQAVVDADPTPQKKMVEWMLKAWEQKGFLWEDIRAGRSSKISRTLQDFERLKGKLKKPDGNPDILARSLMNYKTPGQIWTRLKPELDKEEKFGETPGSREQKRFDTLKARFEALTQVFDSGLKLEMPLSKFSAMKLGRNTKWCTSANEDNMFQSYMGTGMLMIFTLPTGERFQAHIPVHRETELGEDIDFDDDDDIVYDEKETIMSSTFGDELLFAIERKKEGSPVSDVYFKGSILGNIKVDFMNEADDKPTPEEMKLLSPYIEEIAKIALEVSLKSANCIVAFQPENSEIYQAIYERVLNQMSSSKEKTHHITTPPQNKSISDNKDTLSRRDIADKFFSSGLLQRSNEGVILNPSMSIEHVLKEMDREIKDMAKIPAGPDSPKSLTRKISTEGLFDSDNIPGFILSSQNIQDYISYIGSEEYIPFTDTFEVALFQKQNYPRAQKCGYSLPRFLATVNRTHESGKHNDAFDRLVENDFFRNVDCTAQSLTYETIFSSWLSHPNWESAESYAAKIEYVHDFLQKEVDVKNKHLRNIIRLIPGATTWNPKGVSLFIESLARKRVNEGLSDDVRSSKLEIMSNFSTFSSVQFDSFLDVKRKTLMGVSENDIRNTIIRSLETGEHTSFSKSALSAFQAHFNKMDIFSPETYPRHLREVLHLYGGLTANDRGYGELVANLPERYSHLEDDYAYKVVDGQTGCLSLTLNDIHKAIVSSKLPYLDQDFADKITGCENAIDLKIQALEKQNCSTKMTHKILGQMKDNKVLTQDEYYVCIAERPDLTGLINLEKSNLQKPLEFG